jgi:hypothetical protein
MLRVEQGQNLLSSERMELPGMSVEETISNEFDPKQGNLYVEFPLYLRNVPSYVTSLFNLLKLLVDFDK